MAIWKKVLIGVVTLAVLGAGYFGYQKIKGFQDKDVTYENHSSIIIYQRNESTEGTLHTLECFLDDVKSVVNEEVVAHKNLKDALDNMSENDGLVLPSGMKEYLGEEWKEINSYPLVKNEVLPKAETDLYEHSFGVLLVQFNGEGEIDEYSVMNQCVYAYVNPQKQQADLVYLPINLEITNLATNQKDLLKNLSLFGIENVMNSLSSELGHEIKNFMIINNEAFNKILKRVNRIHLNNEYEFHSDNGEFEFQTGDITLSTEKILPYVTTKENLNDPSDQHLHLLKVITGIINTYLYDSNLHYLDDALRDAVGSYITNIKTYELFTLCQYHMDHYLGWWPMHRFVVFDQESKLLDPILGEEVDSIVFEKKDWDLIQFRWEK